MDGTFFHLDTDSCFKDYNEYSYTKLTLVISIMMHFNSVNLIPINVEKYQIQLLSNKNLKTNRHMLKLFISYR